MNDDFAHFKVLYVPNLYYFLAKKIVVARCGSGAASRMSFHYR
jgi:hypothetical protein